MLAGLRARNSDAHCKHRLIASIRIVTSQAKIRIVVGVMGEGKPAGRQRGSRLNVLGLHITRKYLILVSAGA